MADILETHRNSLATADFWKGTKATAFPLLEFICYVAAPHVTNLLIANDCSVTESEANTMRLKSSNYGHHFNDASGDIENLVMRIVASGHVSLIFFSYFNLLI